MNPSEPTPQDIAAVASAIGETPTVAPTAPPVATPPAPAPVQPPAPTAPATPPAPTAPAEPADPFSALFAQPSEPTAPQAPAQPAPTEVTPPAPVAPAEPQAPATPPVTPPAQPPVDDYQTFEEYMNETLKNVPKAPAMPNPEDISPDDPKAIKQFFDDLVNTAVQKASSEVTRKSAIQSRERALWDDAFDKYGSLRDKKPLRDMVHSIRMGYFQRGIAITPKQAADKLLESLGSQYKQGVADSSVVTTIENVQPGGGNSSTPVTTTLDKQSALTAVQEGGEAALAEILDAQIKAGKTW